MKITSLTILFFVYGLGCCTSIDTTKNNSADTTEAEEYNPTLRLEVGFGVGNLLSSSDYNGGMFFSGAELVYQNSCHAVSILYINSGGLGNGPFPNPSLVDFNMYYGLALHSAQGLFVGSVGLNYINRTWPVYIFPTTESISPRADSNATIHSHALGIAFQIQGMWNIVHHFGIGMSIYWNINKIMNDNGLMIGIETGWF